MIIKEKKMSFKVTHRKSLDQAGGSWALVE